MRSGVLTDRQWHR